MGRSALVIGGTGPSGPHVLEGLLERGFDVTIFHRGTHEPPGLPDVRHIHGDPHFPEPIAEAVGTGEWDVVVAAYGRTKLLADSFVGRAGHFLAIGGTPRYAGFNEPERSDQANMTVAQAISSWNTISNSFTGTSTNLVSPAVADTGGATGGQAWLASFMSQATAANLKVDAVAFHWYGVSTPDNPSGAASSFLSRVDSYHNSYGKPVSAMSAYLDAMESAPWRGPDVKTPPVVLAALGPRMLELAARRGAGAHPYFVPVEHTRRAREVLGSGPLLAPEQAVVFASSRAQALEVAGGHLRTYLSLPNYRNNLRRLGWTDEALGSDPPGHELFDALIAWGDEEAILERVLAHLAAGADHVVLQPLTAAPEKPYVEEVRRFGRVISKL